MTPMHMNIIQILKGGFTSLTSARYWRGVLTILFVLAQGFTVSHAAQYNNAPHEHNGMACEIALIAPDADIIEPPAPVITTPQVFVVDAIFEPVVIGIIRTNPCRAPPARGPPTFS